MVAAPLEMAESSLPDLRGEQDRLSVILEVGRAAATLALPDLIERVGGCLQRSRWRWDYTTLCLHEPEEAALRVHFLAFAPGPIRDSHQRFQGGELIPIEGTQSGRAFVSGEPCVVNSRAEYEALLAPAWAAKVMQVLPAEYSSCIVPLTNRGRRLGTLATATPRDRAFDAAAVQFLSQIANAIAPAVDNALAYQQIEQLKDRLARENQYLESEVEAALGEIVGKSPALQRVLTLVESVARTDSSVLISGETGTGKEVIARAIHRLSARRGSTFVKLNCAAIPTGLFEAELFGHERGAFTGALAQKIGRFELADGGTLFLDEVGETPLEVQPKLLHVLQEREFQRVGGTRTIRVDTRVLAATNRDLDEMIANRSFRNDLFYRLNVFPIAVPPLRERREDIPALVRHFVDRAAQRMKKVIDEIPPDVLAALCGYDWPGNVRELGNVVERAVILSPGPALKVSAADLAASPLSERTSPPKMSLAGDRPEAPRRLADAERMFIMRALEETHWVVGGKLGAAARLGLSRTTLQARMRKLGIARPG
jgi:formate hydrogenlyase transcriptional activator